MRSSSLNARASSSAVDADDLGTGFPPFRTSPVSNRSIRSPNGSSSGPRAARRTALFAGSSSSNASKLMNDGSGGFGAGAGGGPDMQFESFTFGPQGAQRSGRAGGFGGIDDILKEMMGGRAKRGGSRSFEPEEDWFYDYRSDQPVEGPTLVDPQHHPLDQSTPGPAERVPDDWEAVLVSHQSRD